MGKASSVLIVSCLMLSTFSVPVFSQEASEEYWREFETNAPSVPRSLKTQKWEELVKRHTWELGPEVSYIDYEEPGVMKEEGVMVGVAGSYVYRGWVEPDVGNAMLKAEGGISFGQVGYTGTGSIDNIGNYRLEFRGVGGYDFWLGESVTLTPYIGFGYRYLNDDSSGKISTTGAVGYERESNYLYSPVGLAILIDLEGSWSVGLTGEYDIFWKGIQLSHLSDALPSLSDLENDQNSGYGVRGAVRIAKRGEKVDLVFEPFVRYWDIEQSELSLITFSGTIVDFGFEPANNSTEYGMKITVQF